MENSKKPLKNSSTAELDVESDNLVSIIDCNAYLPDSSRIPGNIEPLDVYGNDGIVLQGIWDIYAAIRCQE